MSDRDNQTILKIASSIAGEVSHRLLARLVEALSRHLHGVFVVITYGEGNPPTHARAIYALKGEKKAEDVRYELAGTPCHRVYAGETLTVPCDLARLFPREAAFESYIGVPLHDASDSVFGHLAVFSDTPIAEPDIATAITGVFALRAEAELRRLAQEHERKALIASLTDLNLRLNRGYAELRRRNDAKNRLMGLIAHDLRSPLAAVIAQLELGQTRLKADAGDTERIGKCLDKALQNADRLSDLITATLERARAETTALAISPRLTDAGQLVKVAVQANRGDARKKKMELTVSVPTGHMIEVDDVLLVSAIDNLISNAIKYSHEGGRISVTMETADEGTEIVVRDDGQGLSEDDLALAFGHFQTLSARPTGGESSTGLGLANVREIALAHGGTVTARSQGKGKGSEFRLSLPKSGVPEDQQG